MHAVPLMARGRGVAVLYVDSGYEDEAVNLEAIESLVRVAGLTVELRAASPGAQQPTAEAPAYIPMQPEASMAEPRSDSSVSAVSDPDPAPQFEEYVGEVAVEEPAPETADFRATADEVPAASMDVVSPVVVAEEMVEAAPSYDAEEVAETERVQPVNDFAFAPSESYAMPAEPEPEQVEDYSYSPGTNGVGNGHSYEPAPEPEPVVEVASAQPMKSRFSDRHVDLPIEVSEDERRLHNDARRFARLLVSEIKLYNEQKVNEGRNASDLYDRLREAIERSREMYDKRVQPQVATKFDYFHYELVNNLAEGNDSKLGSSYPGSNV